MARATGIWRGTGEYKAMPSRTEMRTRLEYFLANFAGMVNDEAVEKVWDDGDNPVAGKWVRAGWFPGTDDAPTEEISHFDGRPMSPPYLSKSELEEAQGYKRTYEAILPGQTDNPIPKDDGICSESKMAGCWDKHGLTHSWGRVRR
jgi:hypothetical protein